MAVRVVILAAGQGTRMRSDLPKVAHTLAGRAMVNWVVAAAQGLDPAEIVVVVGHQAEVVAAMLPEGTSTCLQEQQNGTGHATSLGLEALSWEPGDTILVLNGDAPLLDTDTLIELLGSRGDAPVSLLTAVLDDASGYGRVERVDGSLARIIEDSDATAAEAEITEINAGMYAFDAATLARELPLLSNNTSQGEYYLPQVLDALVSRGEIVQPVVVDEMAVAGVNDQRQLVALAAILHSRINNHLMEHHGVWMQDPGSVFIDADVDVADGVRMYPNVHLEGLSSVGAGSELGPDVFAVDSSIGKESKVWFAVLRQAVIGSNCEVGPYASLRPGTILKDGAKMGTFVETKNAVVGEGSKIPHLSYVGDATLGKNVNWGAGAITANYDGVDKHHTTVEDGGFIGTDSMLVAPVTIGKNAFTGAGSVISKDVDPGALAVERSSQKQIDGYGDRVHARRAKKKKEKG